ncbi:P-loop containing nucleoside triphosphate hydrolase protein [Paraphysoderma sedebokerense]|nr:P-loop containing nucleoside triphosphate hydrolase protein [Paraphysoderma sedebokerense]
MRAEAVQGLCENNDDEKLPESVVQELMNMSINNKDYSLRVLNLQHEYVPGNPILRGISFGVKNNECLGFLGMNGAGKSTAIKSLTGMINPNGGRAILNGVDLIPFGDELTGKIGICTQHDILYSSMTVLDHLRLYCHVKKLSPTTHGSLIQKLLEDFNITLVKDRIVGELSGGNRRKLSLALSFISCPDIILLDEPTTGIDIRARKMIWDVVLKMKERCCILLTSHSMDEIAYLCDRICILNEGVITFIGSPLGTTYELLIRTTQWTSTPRIKEAITDIFKPFRASLVSRIGSMMTFHLTCSDEGDLSRILKLMETLQSRQGLEGIVEICAGEANLTGIWIKEIGN